MIHNKLKRYRKKEELIVKDARFEKEEVIVVRRAYVKHGKYALNLVLEYITGEWAYMDLEPYCPYSVGEEVDLNYATYNVYKKFNGDEIVKLSNKISK